MERRLGDDALSAHHSPQRIVSDWVRTTDSKVIHRDEQGELVDNADPIQVNKELIKHNIDEAAKIIAQALDETATHQVAGLYGIAVKRIKVATDLITETYKLLASDQS